jgi:hypothetical protein
MFNASSTKTPYATTPTMLKTTNSVLAISFSPRVSRFAR